jgi:hypothetical protein
VTVLEQQCFAHSVKNKVNIKNVSPHFKERIALLQVAASAVDSDIPLV